MLAVLLANDDNWLRPDRFKLLKLSPRPFFGVFVWFEKIIFLSRYAMMPNRTTQQIPITIMMITIESVTESSLKKAIWRRKSNDGGMRKWRNGLNTAGTLLKRI